MGTKTKTTYICDICKSEYLEDKYIAKRIIPITITDKHGCGYGNVDLCYNCDRKLHEVISEYFADISKTDNGLSVTMKF